jgi:two-component system response regulator FixJ
MSESPTVFLVDDDESVRNALRWLIESIGLPVEVFESAHEFLAACDPARPGCLVLDVRMPRMSGLDLQEELAGRQIHLPIIMITGHGDVPMCVKAFERGAFGFLEKPVNHQHLLDQVQRAIMADRKQRDRFAASPALDEQLRQLTPRELEVMELLVSGKTMKNIASELSISVQTCSKHRARVLEKLGVDNDVELVRLVVSSHPTG